MLRFDDLDRLSRHAAIDRMPSARASKCGDVDARTIVPVQDEIGGIVVYAAGRPAYYVLRDEWFEALPEPRAGVRVVDAAEGATAEIDPAATLRVS